ncbi:MAG: hypothetical protein AAB436_02585 [Patescibacteria group bacterium]
MAKKGVPNPESLGAGLPDERAKQREIDDLRIRALASGTLMIKHTVGSEVSAASVVFAPSRERGEDGGWFDQDQAVSEVAMLDEVERMHYSRNLQRTALTLAITDHALAASVEHVQPTRSAAN